MNFSRSFDFYRNSGRIYLSEIPIDKGTEMSKTALIVRADLTTEVIDIAEDGLRKMQTAVGGLIQPVYFGNEVTMWVNEEGLLIDVMQVNYIATNLSREIGYETPMMGDVVFTGGVYEVGYTMALSEQASVELQKIAEMVRKVFELDD